MVTEFFQIKFTNFFIPNFCIVFFVNLIRLFQPTPPKKPPRRNISISPTHIQPMSMSVDGVSNNAYEYVYLASTGTRSQGNLTDIDGTDTRRERLAHGRSVDQYVEMNVFNIALDEDEHDRRGKELHRGKSEDLDCRKRQEPIAITSMYENVPIKQQNPRRKLRRHVDYEDYDFRRKETPTCSSAPETTFVSSAYIMVSDDNTSDRENRELKTNGRRAHEFPLSPTHYNQPPTPDHPPPSALQAESLIHEKMRPLSQVSFWAHDVSLFYSRCFGVVVEFMVRHKNCNYCSSLRRLLCVIWRGEYVRKVMELTCW